MRDFVRSLSYFFLFAMVNLISAAALADQSNVEWINLGEAIVVPDADREDDANHCEIFIDEFFETTQGYRGTSSTSLGMILQTGSDDLVERVGLVAVAFEQSRTQLQDGTFLDIERERTLGFVQSESTQQPGRYYVDIDTSWNRYNTAFGQRNLTRFAFFIDLRRDGELLRLWLKNGVRDFEPVDFSESRFVFSAPVMYGYGSRRYLWRDSGSPIFDRRDRCL